MSEIKYSVVIPCYRSSESIEPLIERLVAQFESMNESFEVICVDDASPDESWEVLQKLRKKDNRIKAIRLFKNHGQHQAIITGFGYASGEFVITMDDDLQHPPEEIPRLIDALGENDVVVGAPIAKKHAAHRNLGSFAMRSIVNFVFSPPKGFVTSAFRLMRKNVADQIWNQKSVYPYISGMIFMVTNKVVNVSVRHEPRIFGKSNYSIFKLARLASNLILNYTKLPLQLLVSVGTVIALLSFMFALVVIYKKIFIQEFRPGWASIIVFISFFGGLNLVAFSIIGEYIIRALNEISGKQRPVVRDALIEHDEVLSPSRSKEDML